MKREKKILDKVREKTGKFPKGKQNSIIDIEKVKVGHLTVNKNIKDDSGKRISIRTGLTAILPYPLEKEMRLFMGSFIFRGKNEITGYEVMDDFCYVNSPIAITNSFNVGRVYDAILTYGFSLGRDETWPPVVIGVNDSYLNNMEQSFLEEKEILEAFRGASDTKTEEGSVGIGVGLRAFGWKGGIGTSSRILSFGNKQFTLGVLVVSNHGNKTFSKEGEATSNILGHKEGSLTIIIGVDIPLIPYQIKQITSSIVVNMPSINTSIDDSDSITCVLFSTANAMPMGRERFEVYDFQLIDESFLKKILLAGSEAIQEAILSSLLKATAVEGKSGRKIEAIPDDEFERLLKEFG